MAVPSHEHAMDMAVNRRHNRQPTPVGKTLAGCVRHGKHGHHAGVGSEATRPTNSNSANGLQLPPPAIAVLH